MASTIDDLLAEMKLVRKGQDSENDETREQAQRERALLGQSEKQYEATLAQRKVTESSQKELQDLESILGGDAKNNKQYQKAEAKLEKEKMKMTKLENRRNLLSRFKDDPKGVIKDTGSKLVEGTKNTFGKLFGFLKKFGALFALLVLPALLLLVNSPVWGILKQKVKDLIEWFGKPDNPIVNFFNDIIKGNWFKAFDDAITRVIKAAFGVEFEGNISDVLKKFVGKFIRGIANLIPENSIFGSLRDKLLNVADKLDPEEAERRKKLAAVNKAELDRLDIDFEGEGEDILAKEQAEQLKKLPGDFREMIENLNNIPKAVLKSVQEGELTIAEGARLLGARKQFDSTGLPKKRGGESQVGYQRRLEAFQALAEQQTREVMPESEKIRAEIDDKQVERDLLQDRVDRSNAGENEFFGSERTSRRVANKEILALNKEINLLNDNLKKEREALAEAKGDANKKPPPIAIGGPTQINNTNPTSNNTSNSPSLKPSGSAGAMAAGAGSMVGVNP